MYNKKTLKGIIILTTFIFLTLTLGSCKNNTKSNYSKNTTTSNKEVKDSGSEIISTSQSTNNSNEETENWELHITDIN